MPRSIPLFLLLSMIDLTGYSQTQIVWKDTVVVNNVRILSTSNTDSRSRSHYGSEYGRMLQNGNQEWLAAYTVSRNYGYKAEKEGGLWLEVAKSTDAGRTWERIATITDPGRDLDNAQMTTLPNGDILLACRSVRWQESYRLPVYRSSDDGHTWERISIIDTNEGKPGELGKPDKGVYEPHFGFLKNGNLAVMYANETHVTDNDPFSQIISEKISTDEGQTWGEEIRAVYDPTSAESRPGMPVWTKMNDNRYILVYEVCGTHSCDVYYKTSKDGFNWPVGIGTTIPEQTGGPYILSLTDGTLVVTSNRGNISISDDYGKNWHTTERAWQHWEEYSKNWLQTIWSSLYQRDDGEVMILTSIQRKEGGHNVQLRIGDVIKR